MSGWYDGINWESVVRECKYSVSAVAEKFRVDRREVHRCIRRLFGLSPKVLFSEMRMRHAAAGLLEGKPVKVVAGDVYYEHTEHFSSAFTRVFGLSPRTYTVIRKGQDAQANGDSTTDCINSAERRVNGRTSG